MVVYCAHNSTSRQVFNWNIFKAFCNFFSYFLYSYKSTCPYIGAHGSQKAEYAGTIQLVWSICFALLVSYLISDAWQWAVMRSTFCWDVFIVAMIDSEAKMMNIKMQCGPAIKAQEKTLLINAHCPRKAMRPIFKVSTTCFIKFWRNRNRYAVKKTNAIFFIKREYRAQGWSSICFFHHSSFCIVPMLHKWKL